MADETVQRLEEELTELREQRRRQMAELGGEDPDDAVDGAAGDTGDAATQLEGLDDLSRTNRRIGELERLIADPDARETLPGLPDGTEVTLRFPDGDVTTLRVVAITAEAPAGDQDEVVTVSSPLGQALVGRTAGDTITYAGPDGDLRAEVVAVESGG